jgi:hypothetical protein
MKKINKALPVKQAEIKKRAKKIMKQWNTALARKR